MCVSGDADNPSMPVVRILAVDAHAAPKESSPIRTQSYPIFVRSHSSSLLPICMLNAAKTSALAENIQGHLEESPKIGPIPGTVTREPEVGHDPNRDAVSRRPVIACKPFLWGRVERLANRLLFRLPRGNNTVHAHSLRDTNRLPRVVCHRPKLVASQVPSPKAPT